MYAVLPVTGEFSILGSIRNFIQYLLTFFQIHILEIFDNSIYQAYIHNK